VCKIYLYKNTLKKICSKNFIFIKIQIYPNANLRFIAKQINSKIIENNSSLYNSSVKEFMHLLQIQLKIQSYRTSEIPLFV